MLRLEARPQPSRTLSIVSPLLALAITVLVGIALFALLGKDPARGLQVFFIEPVKSAYALSELSVKAVEQSFPIVFADYFAPELERLRALADDGLLTIGPDYLSVTVKGRLLIRNVCMVFDRYLADRQAAPRYSKTI